MGWWSTAVMGGDTPLDFQADIEDLIMSAKLRDELYDREPTAKELEVFRTKMTDLLKNEKKIDKMVRDQGSGDYPAIFLQVLGVLAMRYGARIPAKLKRRIITAAKQDDWAGSDKERRAHMKSFVKDLEKYDNKTPTELSEADMGLMYQIAVHLSEGKKGLINK